MFTWPEIVLLVLKIADAIMTEWQNQKSFQAGVDSEIARVSASILAKTRYAKDVRDKIASMDEKAVDNALRDLEPKS